MKNNTITLLDKLLNEIESFLKANGLLILYYTLLFIAPIVIVPSIIHAFYPKLSTWFGIADTYSVVDLTSTIVMATVTTIYVLFTFLIVHTSILNTKQLVVNQKIAFAERRLEMFYLPLKHALEVFDVDKMIDLKDKIPSTPIQHQEYLIMNMIGIWSRFKQEYSNTIPYTYLSLDEESTLLEGFTYIFESNHLFTTYRVSTKLDYGTITSMLSEGCLSKFLEDVKDIDQLYMEILSTLNKNIDSIKNELNLLTHH